MDNPYSAEPQPPDNPKGKDVPGVIESIYTMIFIIVFVGFATHGAIKVLESSGVIVNVSGKYELWFEEEFKKWWWNL